MSGPKTVTLPRRKAKRSSGDEQPRTAESVSRDAIRELAYYKWEDAGCPCCDGVEFWLQAEAELMAESTSAR